MAFEKIIVLDDEMIIRKTLQEELRKRRYSVATASSIAETRGLLEKDNFDLMLVDINLPDGKGTQFLDPLMRGSNTPMVVIMTGDASIPSAVECMRNGAFDYILKPFDIDQIDIVIKKAESFNHLIKVNQFFSSESQNTGLLLGESKPIKDLTQLIKKVAATEATVLILGENGTGKELIAHELYRSSPLADQPFIRVNCAAITETLMESEFFGHEKGAFTGAIQRREGRFELANKGTILLDEISEISLHLQSKLLRVLQEKEFERVGGNKTLKVDVRVIATTNRNLFQAVECGEFREDLFYRLNVFPVHVPPLRERGDDVLLLAEVFMKKFARKHGKKISKLSKQAVQSLKKHHWPGNVRELQNTIERAVIISDKSSTISEMSLGLIPSSPPNKTGEQSLAPFDVVVKNHLSKALEQIGKDPKNIAKALGMNITSLKNLMKKYDLKGQ